jgi:hypothetical protein
MSRRVGLTVLISLASLVLVFVAVSGAQETKTASGLRAACSLGDVALT